MRGAHVGAPRSSYGTSMQGLINGDTVRRAATVDRRSQQAALAPERIATPGVDGFPLERSCRRSCSSPSAVAIFIFVYGFIGYTFYVSLSNWKTAKPDLTIRHPIGADLRDLYWPDPLPDRSAQYRRLHRPVSDHGGARRARLWQSCSIGIVSGAASSAASFFFRTRCRSSPPVWPGAGSSTRKLASTLLFSDRDQ